MGGTLLCDQRVRAYPILRDRRRIDNDFSEAFDTPGSICTSTASHVLQLIYIKDREGILVVLAHHDLCFGDTLLQVRFQLGSQDLLQIRALRIAVEDLNECFALLYRPEGGVVAGLASDEEVDICLLEDVVAAARADAEALDFGCLDARADGLGNHEMPQTAELLRQTAQDFDEGDAFPVALKVTDSSVTGECDSGAAEQGIATERLLT